MFKNKSKKGSKEALGEFSLDSDLDFDFDDLSLDNAKSPKNDRHPALAVPSNVLKGMKDELTSPSFFRKLLKTALPKEFGQAMDFADSSVNELRDIYKTSLTETKPALNQLKRNTEKVLPSVRTALPKKLGDTIDRWAKSGKPQSGGMDPESQKESELTNMLADVFKVQAEANQKDKNDSAARDVIQDTINQTRHNDSMSQMDAIRAGVQRLSDYQDKIGSAFQRKSLEIQYRHYFIARDALEQSKALGIVVKENLEAITKNTALPEAQKLRNSERFKEHMRNRFIGGTLNHLSKGKDALFSKFKENLKNKINDNIKSFADQFENFNMMAEAMGDQMAMANELGIDSKELYANYAGGMLMGSLGARIGRKIRGKIKDNDKINKAASSIGYWLNNKEEGLKKILDSKKLQSIPGGSALADFLRDLIPTDRGVEIGADMDSSKFLQEPSIFNNQTRKSITEIIPGYLARIYREIQIFRTGNESTPLTKYDYNSNKFTTQSSVSSGLLNKIAGKSIVSKNKETTGRLISQLDPYNRLSKEERNALHEQFSRDRLNGVSGTSQHYSDESAYRGAAGKFATKFAEMFKRHFELNDNLEMADTQSARDKRLQFSYGYESILENYVDKSEEIQEMINMGQYDELRELGIVKENGEFDRDKLLAYYAGTGNNKQSKKKKTGNDVSNAINKNNNRNKNRNKQNNPTPNLPPVVIPVLPPPTVNPMDLLLRNQNNREPTLVNQRDLSVGGSVEPTIINPTRDTSSPIGSQAHKSSFDVLVEIRDILLDFKSKGISLGLSGGGNINGALNGAGSALGMIGMGAGNLLTSGFNSVRNMLPKIAGHAGNLLKMGRDAAKTAGNWLLKKKDEADVYIKGEVKPRLEAWKLQAGFYYDQVTGKVITKLSDIKNTIVDKDGNVILDISEFKNIYINTKSRAVEALSKLKDLAITGIQKATALGNSFYAFAYSKAKQLFNYGREKLAGDDVYVVGRTEPALTALLMRGGNYYSKNTGKRIWKAFQIDGPVIDREGNVLLSMDDLKLGIVDKHGQAFKGPVAKLMEMGKEAFGRVKNIAIGAFNKARDITKSVFGSVSSFITGRGKNDSIKPGMFRNSDNGIIAKILMDIKRILLDRLVARKKNNLHDLDGDGLRDNSWQERAKNAKNKILGKLEGGKEMAAGSIAALTATMSKLVKTLKEKTEAEESGGGIMDTISDWIGGGKDKNGRTRRTRPGHVPKSKLGKAWYYTKNFGKKTLGLGKKLLSPLAKMGSKSKALLGMLTLGSMGKLFGGSSPGAGAAAATNAAGATANAATSASGAAGGLAAGTAEGAAMGASRGVASSIAKKIPYLGTALGALELGSTWSGNGTTKEKTLDTGGILGGMGGGFAGGAAMGAAAGAIFGGVGAIPGAIIGGMLGTMVGSKAGRSMTKMLYENPKSAMAAMGAVFPIAPAIMGIYKLFSGGSSNGSLSKLRYAQYGFTSEESSHISTINDLEERLLKDVKITNGTADYDDKKLDLEKIFSMFGVPVTSEQHVKRWCRWYKTRFKPIFLTHVSALANINPKASIQSADGDLSASEKSKYLETVAYPGGPYAFQESPFSLVETLKTDATYVSNLVSQIKSEVAKNAKDGDKKVNTTPAAATPITTQIAGANANAKQANVGNAQLNIKKDTNTASPDTNKSIQISGTIPLMSAGNLKLDALSVIRLKAYGLFNMTTNQVNSLLMLEKQIEEDISYSNGGQASWDGNIDRMLAKAGPLFGVSSFETARGEDFVMWFRARFLPVYLSMAGSVYQITSKSKLEAGLNALKPSQKVSVAQAIIAARGKYNTNDSSIWNVKESPWNNYTLNGDRTSTDINLKALQDASKNDIVEEKTNKIVVDPTKGSNASANQNTTKVNKEEPSFWNKATNAVSNAWDSTKNFANKAATSISNGIGTAVSSAGSAIKTGYNATVNAATNAMESVGTAVKTGLTALGGMASQLPMPTSVGTYEGLKPLIHAAAAMAGVDPLIMAIMAAQESGFRPDAKAPGGSATGLFQFIKSTWNGMLQKYGKQYGVPMDADPKDPRANAIMGALFTRDNVNTLQRKLGRVPTQTDVYLGHFLGPDTAAKFIKSDPNAIGAQLYPKEAASNKSIFYDGNRPRTIGEIYQWFTKTIDSRAKQFKIIPGGADTKSTTKPVANSPAKPTTPAPVAPSAVQATDLKFKEQPKVSVPANAPVPSAIAKTTASSIIDNAPAKSSINKPSVVASKAMSPSTGVAPEMTQGVSMNAVETSRAVANRSQNDSKVSRDSSDILTQSLGIQQQSLDTQKSMLEALVAIRASINNGNGFRQPQTNTNEPKVANSDVKQPNSGIESTIKNQVGNLAKDLPKLVSMAKTFKR